jgi:tetratricopeptide (TPR) repeat protein
MSPTRSFACACALLLLAFAAQADSLLKSLPTPDLGKLPPAAREEITTARATFEQLRNQGLVGDGLAQAYGSFAGLHARYGLWDVSRAALDNAIALSPGDGRWPYLRGVFQWQSGDPTGARPFLEQALKLDEVYLPIRYRLAELQLVQGDNGAALRTLQPIIAAHPDQAHAFTLAGEAAMNERRYRDAVANYEKALKAEPRANLLYARIADARTALGDAAGATAARAKAGKSSTSFNDPMLESLYAPSPSSPAELALSLASRGQHDGARAALDEALKATPNDVALLSAYARVAADAGDTAGARAKADAALRAAPNDASANLAMAMVLETAGQEAQALAYYEKASRADAADPQAHALLGNAYLRRRQYPAAAQQYRELARLVPGDASAFARYAVAQSLGGRCGDGLREVNAQLKARPKDGGLLQTFVRLASTCAAASAEERTMAVDYGKSLYRQRPDAAHSEALAMAMAATGKSSDAVDFEAQAIFDALKRQDNADVERKKVLLERFKAGQAATTPWPAGHPFLDPPRLQVRGATPPGP